MMYCNKLLYYDTTYVVDDIKKIIKVFKSLFLQWD